jgi:hypothetical protein
MRNRHVFPSIGAILVSSPFLLANTSECGMCSDCVRMNGDSVQVSLSPDTTTPTSNPITPQSVVLAELPDDTPGDLRAFDAFGRALGESALRALHLGPSRGRTESLRSLVDPAGIRPDCTGWCFRHDGEQPRADWSPWEPAKVTRDTQRARCGTVEGTDSLYRACLDLGGWTTPRTLRPMADNGIEFEDLMMVPMNLHEVGFSGRTIPGAWRVPEQSIPV